MQCASRGTDFAAFSEVITLGGCFIEILSIPRELEAVLVGSFERGSVLEQGRAVTLGTLGSYREQRTPEGLA